MRELMSQFTAYTNAVRNIPKSKIYNEQNYFDSSYAIWKEIEITPTIDISKPDYISPSGSKYWYKDGGVYRMSDHWGFVGSCYWEAQGNNLLSPDQSIGLHFCFFGRFRPFFVNLSEGAKVDESKFYIIREFGFELSKVNLGRGVYMKHPTHHPDKLEVLNPHLEHIFSKFLDPLPLMHVINELTYQMTLTTKLRY